MRLANKTVVLTGAGSGIGLAAVTLFAKEGAAEEIANVMLFLASDESSICTGGVYLADGGLSAIWFRSSFGRTPFRSIPTNGGNHEVFD